MKPSLPKEENDGFEDFGSEEDEGWGDEEGGSIFDEITSIINMRKTTGASGSLVVGELLDPFPTKSDLPRLKKEILSDKNILGNLIGAKGQHSVILLRTMLMEEEDSHKIFFKLLEFAKKHSKPGSKLLIGGMPAFEATMNTTVLGDLRKLVLSALGFMVFLLFFIFRHPLAVIGPILVVGQSAIWTLGSMAIMGYPMTMITNIIPSFLFCVGLGDSIHIISIYRDRIAEGMDSFEALNYSISHSGMPILFTSLTTMVGLLSLNAASLDSIGEMGLVY